MTTAMIVDDEPLLRDQLRMRLTKLWPTLKIVAACENGAEAVTRYEELTPDVIFLDIHMPVMNGLDAARVIGRGREVSGKLHRAHIVFITAYDQHALAAFAHRAIDYVLKPYDDARLTETIERLQERLAADASHIDDCDDISAADIHQQHLMQALKQLATGQAATYLQWIKASVGQTVRLIPVEDVLYFQSDEKYTRVVLADSEVLIRTSIRDLLEELDPARFWQIHRATIVNTRAVASVTRGLRDHAELSVKGRSDTLVVSRNFTHLFKQM
jgi:DNA-binding LytR/AlgR family response regulator